MALVPYENRIRNYKDWKAWNDWIEVKRKWDDEVAPNDWILPTPATWIAYRDLLARNGYGYLRPWVDTYYGDLNCVERDVKITKDLFTVQLDVHHFKSYEITVKVVGNTIVVKGKHDKRPKVNGYIEREFERKYDLSNDFRIRDVTSAFSSDGILTIKAYPVVPAPALAYYRDVPVYQTFKPSYWD